jgi:hypothetical protein
MPSPQQDRRAAERLRVLAERLSRADPPARRSRHDDPDAYEDPLRRRAFPGLEWNVRLRLASRDTRVVEQVIGYLEADPWHFGSGYEKENCLRGLRHMPLTRSQKARLQVVILTIVGTRDGREFRRYCALAPDVDGPGFREALAILHAAPSCAVRRRAGWVLDAMAHGGAAAPLARRVLPAP